MITHRAVAMTLMTPGLTDTPSVGAGAGERLWHRALRCVRVTSVRIPAWEREWG